MMKKSYCLVSFHRYGASQLDSFTNRVQNGIYTNASVFATPPVTLVDFTAMLTLFLQAAAEYEQYGITKRTAYMVAKEDLIEMLDTLVAYVNGIADGDVSIIALSGFDPSREVSQPSQPLPKIENYTAKRSDNAGEIVVSIPAIVGYGVVTYCCICSEEVPLTNFTFINGKFVINPDDPRVYQDFNKTRRKVFSGLTPGKVYYFYVFAINTVSVSPFSDAKQVMAA